MTHAKKILGFNDLWLMLVGIPIITFITNALIFTELMLENPWNFLGTCGGVGLVYTIIYWLTFRQTVIFFKSKFPSQKDFGKRILLQTASILAFYFFIKIALDPILHPMVENVAMTKSAAHGVAMAVAGLTVTFLVIGVYETAMFYFQLQKEQLEKEQLQKENMRGQLEGLKNQVNPHFFFNSLNTLAYLIPEDPAKAENFVQKLSKAYRYILEIRERETVALEEELNFLDSYTCLLNERFGENLNISIDVPGQSLQMGVVPLAMQMLFENAIKHNVASARRPLSIELTVQKGRQLVVKNNLQRKKQVMNSTKVGLENIKRRYRLLSEREVEVLVTEESFIVILPLLEKDKECEINKC